MEQITLVKTSFRGRNLNAKYLYIICLHNASSFYLFTQYTTVQKLRCNLASE